jgi:hypothetical protein
MMPVRVFHSQRIPIAREGGGVVDETEDDVKKIVEEKYGWKILFEKTVDASKTAYDKYHLQPKPIQKKQ